MDTVADTAITFDEAGICHHCIRYDTLVNTRTLTGIAGKNALDTIVAKIKKKW